MISHVFAFPLNAVPVREQAYYEAHANANRTVRRFKWLVAALLVFVWCIAFATDSAHAAESDNRITPITAPMTVFIDGPTGFVFVYTADGWKFVRSTGAGK